MRGMGMETGQGMVCLAGVCAFIVLVAGWQKRMEVLKNFVLRLAVGMAVIFAGNLLLAKTGIDISVGMNPISFFTAGTLGLPGVAMLYGIAGCRLL